MSCWLDPVRAGLDARTTPVSMFVRDDDAGWVNDRLYALVETACRAGVPIDVAVIPGAADAALAREMRRADADLVHLHQHGCAHANHEIAGRKCEFGASRSRGQQRADIAAGRARLLDLIGDRVEPIFTPPWNRCTCVTAQCLADLDFELLSRDASAPRFDVAALGELPVALDWTGRRGACAGTASWGVAIADRIRTAHAPVGLMLHHGLMTDDDRRLVADLLGVLSAHRNVRFGSMLALARRATTRGVM